MTTFTKMFESETWQKLRGLALPPEKKCMIAGVCTAFGDATPVPAWMWRVLFCATMLAWGTGIVAYVVLWICIPNQEVRE